MATVETETASATLIQVNPVSHIDGEQEERTYLGEVASLDAAVEAINADHVPDPDIIGARRLHYGNLEINLADGSTYSVPVAGPPTFTAPIDPHATTSLYRHPTPIPGADLFAAGVESGAIPPGVWADWLDEKGVEQWFAYALRWMQAKKYYPIHLHQDLTTGLMQWQWSAYADERSNAIYPSSIIPYPLLACMPGMTRMGGMVYMCRSETYPDAVALLSLGLQAMHKALSLEAR